MGCPLVVLMSTNFDFVLSIQGEALAGAFEGTSVVATGDALGDIEGEYDGAPVGATGDTLGDVEGEALGDVEGEDDGTPVDATGDALGNEDGISVTVGQVPTQIFILARLPMLFTFTVTSSPLKTESDVQLPPALSFASSTDLEL
jgi:hypothetical protein